MTGRSCIFCGRRADTKEHLFPDWVNRLVAETSFRGVSLVVTNEGMKRRRYDTDQAAHLAARIVCHRCNHGWMSDLEKEAGALLKPMAIGDPTRLTTPEQLVIAQWAAKTAMVGEWIMEYRPLVFSQEDREVVRTERRPPIRARVCLAAYSREIPTATRFCRTGLTVQDNNVPLMDVYIHTIQILHVILQVRGTHSFPVADNRSLERIAEPRDIEIPLFPPVVRCDWPPPVVLDGEAFHRYTAAGVEPPGPPPSLQP
jgi:hypothetical protein